jgi:S-adenosylmethionine hydrolase
MKTRDFALLFLLVTSTIFSNELVLATKFTEFYNQLLSDQSAIQKINLLRPKIYIYTDFGGGENKNRPLVDLQTSGEISSAAWKETLQQELYINDSAQPLSPIQAALCLARTFPYKERSHDDIKKISIHTIVVHVVDPGVGNDLDTNNPQPRSMILRRDGVLFIGPDNGTLSFVCPSGSIAGSWEIDIDALTLLSGIDTKVGGTFHGRDVFCEAALRIAAGMVSPNEIGSAYATLDIRNRVILTVEYQRQLDALSPLEFECVHTERFIYNAHFLDENELFDKAFLLGIVPSSLYQDGQTVALTHSKKLFLPDSMPSSDLLIAIVNHKNGNIFIGPNNGLGSAFINNSHKEIEVFTLTKEVFETIKKENNNEVILSILKQQTHFYGRLSEIDFLGGQEDLIKDEWGRPKSLKAKIWVDLYGNIKTTVSSTLLNEVKQLHASVDVLLNGVKRRVSFAETFSQVPSEQLFIYNGSTGTIDSNPHRSKRYVELTANGIFGKFGIDFFEKNGVKPRSGDSIWLYFNYWSLD